MIQRFNVPEAERLCEKINGDGTPVYIALQSALPAWFGEKAGVHGLTSKRLAEILRPYLPQWRGPGFAMVIWDDSIRVDEGSHSDFYTKINVSIESRIRRRLWGISLHELSHLVERQYRPPAKLSPEKIQAQIASLRAWCGTPSQGEFREGAELFSTHGLLSNFIRSVVHVHHRAVAAGLDLTPPFIFETEQMAGFRPIRLYCETLGDEPRRLAGLPCHEIQAIDPPSAFTEMHKRDVQRWFASRRAARSEPPLHTDEGVLK